MCPLAQVPDLSCFPLAECPSSWLFGPITCFPSLSSEFRLHTVKPGLSHQDFEGCACPHLNSPTSWPGALSSFHLFSASVSSHLSLSCLLFRPSSPTPGLESSFLLSGIPRPVVGTDPRGSWQASDNPQHCWEPSQGHRAPKLVTPSCHSECSL